MRGVGLRGVLASKGSSGRLIEMWSFGWARKRGKGRGKEVVGEEDCERSENLKRSLSEADLLTSWIWCRGFRGEEDMVVSISVDSRDEAYEKSLKIGHIEPLCRISKPQKKRVTNHLKF